MMLLKRFHISQKVLRSLPPVRLTKTQSDISGNTHETSERRWRWQSNFMEEFARLKRVGEISYLYP